MMAAVVPTGATISFFFKYRPRVRTIDNSCLLFHAFATSILIIAFLFIFSNYATYSFDLGSLDTKHQSAKHGTRANEPFFLFLFKSKSFILLGPADR